MHDIDLIDGVNTTTPIRRQAAVSLYFFHCKKSVGLHAKRDLRLEIFHKKSGFECDKRDGRHYQRIWRQVNTFSKLAEKIGFDKLFKIVQAAGAYPEAAISRIDDLLAQEGLDSLEAMADYFGGDSSRRRRKENGISYCEKHGGNFLNIDAGHQINVGELSLLIPLGSDLVNILKLKKQLEDYYENQILDMEE